MNKQYRVKKSQEIEQILIQKKSFGNKYFVVYKKENSEATNFRYAISVGKKVGNAVMRNKVKRQIRSIVDSLLVPTLKMDVFVVARPNVCNITYEEMVKQITYLFKKLNIETKGAKL